RNALGEGPMDASFEVPTGPLTAHFVRLRTLRRERRGGRRRSRRRWRRRAFRGSRGGLDRARRCTGIDGGSRGQGHRRTDSLARVARRLALAGASAERANREVPRAPSLAIANGDDEGPGGRAVGGSAGPPCSRGDFGEKRVGRRTGRGPVVLDSD